jgi:hypothetical protein
MGGREGGWEGGRGDGERCCREYRVSCARLACSILEQQAHELVVEVVEVVVR